jgi:glycosyltransferase involved in cell wall biosynthesis
MFDPLDPRAIAAAITELMAGGPAIERLRVAGRERAAQFTWERTASLTLESYARALAGP